jgi:DNA polymerase-3 subunit delta
MMGGRRVVRVRGAGNGLTELFETFLEAPPGDALVVVEAGDLAKSAALRKLFEEDEVAAALACYADTARSLEDLVRDALRAEGFSIAPDALADAVSRLGSDRGVSRRELEKLALYCHGRKSVSLEDVRAVMGDEAEARAEEASDAAGGGDFARLDLALERLWNAETSAIAVIRAAMGHFQRLLLVKENMNRGENLDSAMRQLRPPVHFLRAESFKAQARVWNGEKLGDALDMLLEAETLSKTTAVPNEALCGRTLMNIAAMAKGRA